MLDSEEQPICSGTEQGALRKQCQTCQDIFVNRLIYKILLWRCKTSVFLNRERKDPTTFKRMPCLKWEEHRKRDSPGLADEIFGYYYTARTQRKWGHKSEKERSKYNFSVYVILLWQGRGSTTPLCLKDSHSINYSAKVLKTQSNWTYRPLGNAW